MYGHDLVDRLVAELVGLRRGRSPRLKPPPASQSENPWRLWSRPSEPCETGRRPNSPVQRTIVESREPALLQVRHQSRARLIGAGECRFQASRRSCCACPRAGRS